MENGLYNVLWHVFRAGFGLLMPCRASGMENVPGEGGFILCLNHVSAWDPLWVAARLPRSRRLYFLAKKELFSFKPLGAIIRAIGGIPVDRGNADIGAVRTTMQLVKAGNAVGIFPQGTRSRDNSPTPMLPGAAMIAMRAGVPVIPCYIGGPKRLLRRSEMNFGAPIDFSDLGRRMDQGILEEATRRIADAVWGLRKEPLLNESKT